MLSSQEKRVLQKTIIEQNRILAGTPAPHEKIQAQQIKREAMDKLGIGIKSDSERE